MPGNHLGRPEPLPGPRSLLAVFDEHSHLATGGLLAVGGQLPHLQFTRWSFPHRLLPAQKLQKSSRSDCSEIRNPTK
jgi:hypothetical protein